MAMAFQEKKGHDDEEKRMAAETFTWAL